MSPAHPLIHIALSGIIRPRGRAEFLREFGLKRLMDPENKTVYGRATMARYARVAAEMLGEQNDPERAATALARAEELEASPGK